MSFLRELNLEEGLGKDSGAGLLRIEAIKKHFLVGKEFLFSAKAKLIRAVDGVDLVIQRGATLGLVGESGCGKSTLGRTILKLMEPTSGKVIYNSIDYTDFDRIQMLPLRREMQMIFQDPYSSLNPRMPVGLAVGEPLIAHGIEKNGRRVRERVLTLFEEVGLGSDFYNRYPHEMSGGQRQRVGLARALIMSPKLIVCDEPVSALDVSIQAQILNMFKELQQKLDLTYVFITHDLRVARYMSTQIAVMYLGAIAEVSFAENLFTNPFHPYTKALLSSIPSYEPRGGEKKRIVLTGDVPTPLNLPKGCRFHPRCQERQERCMAEEPVLRAAGEGHRVACHHYA
jgi:oligopeptide transport system ATP-binding protein